MTKPHGVVIIGVGRIGQAFIKLLQPQPDLIVMRWDTDTAKMPEPAVCNDLVQQSDVIFLCIPSWAMRESLQGMAPCLRDGAIVVSLVKGLDPTSRATMHELMQELLPSSAHAAVCGGPMLSAELEQGLPTSGVVGADAARFTRLNELFSGTELTLQHSLDPAGVSAAGVLKNVYALGLGIAQALKLGDNMRGWLVAQALHEMSEVVPQWGGQSQTVYGLAGLGDLVATSLSQHSRNRTVGEELVAKGTTSMQSEGLASLALVAERLGKTVDTVPFLSLVHRIVTGQQPAAAGFKKLRETLSE